MEKKYLSLKELEQTINIEEFMKDYCSDNGLDYDKLCEKYNGSLRNIQRYTEKHFLKRSKIYTKNKRKQTNLEKYGVEYSLQNKEIQEKIKQTCIEKYGVLYACQTENCKNASNGMHSKPNENFAKMLDNNDVLYTREYPIDRYSFDFRIIIKEE